MRIKPLWYCSIAPGVPYTAIRVHHATAPTVTFGFQRDVRFAACTIARNAAPTYEYMQIAFEDATGVRLPDKKGSTNATD